MKKSATLLGKEVGLNGQEMNRALVHCGYLEGEPGNYHPTEKAEPFVSVKEYHRGCGGSPWYNREWDQTSFDEAILNEMNITDELKKIVKEEVSENLRKKREKREAYSEQYYALLDEESNEDSYEDGIGTFLSDSLDTVINNWNTKCTIVTAAIAVGVVALYKAEPHIKKWWKGLQGKRE